MKTFFAAKKSLSVALALAAFTAAGSVSAFAQSRDHTGSMMPTYYKADGEQVTGSWGPAANAGAQPVQHQAVRHTRELIQNAGRTHTQVQ
jgi:hypothetical protein